MAAVSLALMAAIGKQLPASAAEKSTVVLIADLDLSTEKGMETARERVHQAARKLCNKVVDPWSLSHHPDYVQCVDDATADAVTQLQAADSCERATPRQCQHRRAGAEQPVASSLPIDSGDLRSASRKSPSFGAPALQCRSAHRSAPPHAAERDRKPIIICRRLAGCLTGNWATWCRWASGSSILHSTAFREVQRPTSSSREPCACSCVSRIPPAPW